MIRVLLLTIAVTVPLAAYAADPAPMAPPATEFAQVEQQNRLREMENAKLRARVKELEEMTKQKEAESLRKTREIETLTKQAQTAKKR